MLERVAGGKVVLKAGRAAGMPSPRSSGSKRGGSGSAGHGGTGLGGISSGDGIVVRVMWDDLEFAFAQQDVYRQLLDFDPTMAATAFGQSSRFAHGM